MTPTFLDGEIMMSWWWNHPQTHPAAPSGSSWSCPKKSRACSHLGFPIVSCLACVIQFSSPWLLNRTWKTKHMWHKTLDMYGWTQNQPLFCSTASAQASAKQNDIWLKAPAVPSSTSSSYSSHIHHVCILTKKGALPENGYPPKKIPYLHPYTDPLLRVNRKIYYNNYTTIHGFNLQLLWLQNNRKTMLLVHKKNTIIHIIPFLWIEIPCWLQNNPSTKAIIVTT